MVVQWHFTMEKSVKNHQKKQIQANQIGCVYDLK